MKINVKDVKKLLLLTGTLAAGFSLTSCKSTVTETSYTREIVPEEDEAKGVYGFSSISKLASRAGTNYIGFYKETYDVMGYPRTGFVRYEEEDALSVLQTEDAIYIVKGYEEGRELSTYYDYLRDSAVGSLESFTVTGLQEYMGNHDEMFSDALLDCYLHFQMYDAKSILDEERLSITDLAKDRGESFLGISRNVSTLRNVGIVTYVPVNKLNIIYNGSLSYLVEDYVSDEDSMVRQHDLLRGNNAPKGATNEVYNFSDYVLENADSFDAELVTYLQANDILQSYYLPVNEFVVSFENSIKKQDEAKVLKK